MYHQTVLLSMCHRILLADLLTENWQRSQMLKQSSQEAGYRKKIFYWFQMRVALLDVHFQSLPKVKSSRLLH